MSTDVITVRPQDQLEKVADLMMEYGHATFPVIDENNSVVGVIGRTHMLEYDISSLPVVGEGKIVGIISPSDWVEAVVHPSLGGGQR